MSRLSSLAGPRRLSIAVVTIALSVVGAGVALAAAAPAITTITPNHADQMTNIDVLRQQIKNYYGAPLAAAGPTGTWAETLNNKSNYAREMRAVAAKGADWLAARSHAKIVKPAIVLDVDDTTLTTWNYELYSNWDYNPGTNAVFVGLTTTGTPPVTTFTGNLFPPTPGMLAMVRKAHDLGYAIFWITGRGDAQHAATIANLVSDTAAGLPDITSVTYSGATLPEVDAGYPMPTAVDIGHGGFTDGLFTKPPVGSYPAYLDKPEFCAPYIHATPNPVSCPTIQYKSGTRAYIESLGYDIVADFGDQFSDLKGGHADKTFKLPNPNYFLP